MEGPLAYDAPSWSTFLSDPPDQTPHPAQTVQDDDTPDQPMNPGCLKVVTPLEENFRHSFWQTRRQRVIDSLDRLDIPAARKFSFAHCGANAYVEVQDHTGKIRMRSVKCHDRFCEACQQERGTILRHALAERAQRSKTLHVVLTLRSSSGPLKPSLDRLYKCASKLRQDKWWKLHVKGGSQTLELTRNATTGEWHPHLHLLVHADYLDQQKLSALWLKVTGDSYVVHVSLVQRHDAAVREVTKYLAKPIHRSIDFVPDALDELIPALKGRRMLVTFGTWRMDPLLKDRDQDADGQWRIWGTYACLARRAAQGDEWCRQTMHYLASLRPGRVHRDPPPPKQWSHLSDTLQPAAP